MTAQNSGTESLSFLNSTLSAIFPEVSARLTFINSSDPTRTFTTTRENGILGLDLILKFGRATNGDVLLSLDTGKNPVGFTMTFAPQADTAATVLPPSFTLEHDDGRMALVYLLAGDTASMAALRSDLEPVEGDRYTLGTMMPTPFGSWVLSEAAEALIEAGRRFPVFDCTVVEAAFFPDGQGEPLLSAVLESGEALSARIETSIEDAVAAGKPFFDATVTGELVPGVLDEPFIGSVLSSQKSRKVENRHSNIRGLYRHVAEHPVSDSKIGPGITACHLDVDKETGRPRRKKRNVSSNGAFMFDFDGGQTTEEILSKFEALGCTFAAYSSYNHLKTEGVHKLRVILPHAKPFVPDEHGDRENYAAAVWRSSLDAFCEKHGLELDRNARDITRFMNSPRHPKGGIYFSRIHLGPLYEMEVVLPEDRPIGKIAKTKNVKIDYNSNGEVYVADGNGVEFFLSLIGDGPDQLGYHNPVFRALCSYFSPVNEGPDADFGPIKRRVREVIEKAEKGPGRVQIDIDRYVSDGYLNSEVENARAFIRGLVAAKEAAEQLDKERIDDLVADYRMSPDPKKLEDLIDYVVQINRVSLTAYCRDELAKPEKGKAKVARGTFNELEKSAKSKRRETTRSAAVRPTDRQTIYSDDNFPDQCNALLKGLRRLNDPPYLFIHGGDMKRLPSATEQQSVASFLKLMSFPDFKTECNNAVTYIVASKDGERVASLADDIPAHIWGMRDKPVPEVVRFSRVPVFGPDGTLRTEEGYDPATRMILQTSALNIDPVPAIPSPQDVATAKDWLLNKALADFPAADDFGGSQSSGNGSSSRAHIVVMLLQQFVREMYIGPTPFFFIDKPQPGTGASLLVELLYQIVVGRPASPQVLGKNEEEVRKGITSKLMGGAPIIFYDNVRNKIHGEALATLGTADWWEDRVLGRTETYAGPNRALTVFTGNNMTMADEMVRRMLPIRLDAQMSDPENRVGFVVPDLRKWMVEFRAKLIWSCIVLVQNWIATGRKRSTVHFASYEDFAAVMGGILEAADIAGFLGNLHAFRTSAKIEATDETDVMQELLKSWSLNTPFSTADAHGILFNSFGQLRFPSLNINEEDAAAQKRILGLRLRNHIGRQFKLSVKGNKTEVRFQQAGQRDHSARWQFTAPTV